MSNTPLLSVVIPTFNSADMTCRSLDSLLKQTLKDGDFEIVVINNNSTDNTLERVTAYAENNPSVSVYTQKQQGISHTRNMGIEQAKGEYILFLDGTKEAGEHVVQKTMDHFRNIRPEPLSVGGRYIPRFEGKKPFWYDDQFEIRTWGNEPRFLTNEEAYTGFVGGICAFRKDLLEHVNGFDTTLGMSGGKLRAGEEPDLYRKIYELQDDNTNTIYYDPDLYVYTRVPMERLTLRYRLRRSFGFGISSRVPLKKRGTVRYLVSLPMPFFRTIPMISTLFAKDDRKRSTKAVVIISQLAWYAGYYWTR